MMAALAMAALVAALVLPAAPAGAQISVGPGSLTASVRDPDGRPVPGALVVIDGPTTRQATTGIAGIVALSALPLGTYSISVTRSGYEPATTSVVVRAAASATQNVVSVSLAAATFANLRAPANAVLAGTLDGGNDPFVPQALTATPGVEVLPVGTSGAVGASLLGTAPAESRVELDGIPLAGGPAALTALGMRSALSLASVGVAEGPFVTSSSVRDAIGGILNFRTPAISTAPSYGLVSGYDSAFGAFQQARFSDTFGRLGVLADAVTGGGEERSQTFKLRYAFGAGTSLGFASYGSQSATASAPAYAADLRASLGAGSLQARLFGSSAAVLTEPDFHDRGLQASYDLPSGGNLFSLGFDRRSEEASFANTDVTQTFTSLTLRSDLALSSASHLEIGDAYSGGAMLAPRNDPQLALTFRAAQKLTLRLALGSAFATAPAGSLFGGAAGGAVAGTAAAGTLASPETSFGYRASADASLGTDHLRFTAFQLQRYDTFGALSNARSTGLEIGFERPDIPGHIGGSASLDFARTYGYGALQPLARNLDALPLLVAGSQATGDPYAKGRIKLDYVSGVITLSAGATLLGANNALTPQSAALADASLRVRALGIFDVRLGLENMFGLAIANPALVPFYQPHEYTLTLGTLAR